MDSATVFHLIQDWLSSFLEGWLVQRTCHVIRTATTRYSQSTVGLQ